MYIYYLVMGDEWILTFDAVFFLTIGSLVCAGFTLVIRYCLKSKCDHINLCFGLITVHRNVELEVEEEMKQMELGNIDDDSME
jgi:hypothetical protein